MRFTNQPRILKKQRAQMLANALGDLAIASMPASSSEAVQLIGRIPMALERLKPGDGRYSHEFEIIKSRIGIAFGEFLAMATGWEFGWLVTKEKDPYHDFDVVTSPDRAYFVSPIAVVGMESCGHPGQCQKVLDYVLEGMFPNSAQGVYFDLVEYFRNPEKVLRETAVRRHALEQGKGNSHFDEAIYRRFVERWGAPLPEAYLEFLRTFDGTAPENACFEVAPGEGGSEWADVFTMQEHAPQSSLMQVFDWRGIPLMPRMLPIGGDGAFGYVLMSFREGETGAIYFCATHTDDGSVEYYESQGYWKVAASFPEFLDGLASGDDED